MLVSHINRKTRSQFSSVVLVRLLSEKTYYGNKGKILASIPYFQSVDPEESPVKYLQHWSDMSVIKQEGRVFDADKGLLDPNNTFIFPRLKATTLSNKEISVPDAFADKPVKLIVFSLNKYGENATKTWLDPFVEKYGSNHPKIHIVEVCFLEYKWLSMFQSTIISSMKANKQKLMGEVGSKSSPNAFDNVVVSIGTIMDFAKAVRLPNKYTGYLCLVDSDNKIRWRGCGRMMTGKHQEVPDGKNPVNPVFNRYDEFALLSTCTDALLKEPHKR